MLLSILQVLKISAPGDANGPKTMVKVRKAYKLSRDISALPYSTSESMLARYHITPVPVLIRDVLDLGLAPTSENGAFSASKVLVCETLFL